MTRRQTEAALRKTEDRLSETLLLLAAVAVEFGEDAQLRISQQRMDDVRELAEVRVIALRRLDNGDLRVDFCEAGAEPELVCQ
jgi:hypothetical protein